MGLPPSLCSPALRRALGSVCSLSPLPGSASSQREGGYSRTQPRLPAAGTAPSSTECPVPNIECFCGAGLTSSQAEEHPRTPMLEGAWGERSRAGTPGPRLHRLLPEQCHMTGFSLFITVFIVLGAAGLVLAGGSGVGREGSTQWGAELLLGCWSGAQSQPLGASWCLLPPVLWVACGGRVHCYRDGHARNTKTQRKPLLGTFQPLNRTWHFLHLPPTPGPRHARGAPETQL